MPINWEDYLKEVMPDVKGCPIRVAENAIRNAAIDFCNESRAWRDPIDDVTTSADVHTYPLSGPTDSEIIALYYVKRNSANLPLKTIPDMYLDRHRQNPNTQEPKWFHQPSPQEIRFVWTPDAEYTYKCKAILKPTKDAESGPDFLYNDWMEVIAHGAKMRLKMMSGRDWFDPKTASYDRKEFIKGKTEARIRDAKSNVASSTRARPGYFGTFRNSGGW